MIKDYSCLDHNALHSGGTVQPLWRNVLLLISYPEDRGICSSKILVHIWLHILKTVICNIRYCERLRNHWNKMECLQLSAAMKC